MSRWGNGMEALGELGMFFAGLGIFFAGCGLLWGISVWQSINKTR